MRRWTKSRANYPKWVGDNEAPIFTPETEIETRAWIKAMMLSVQVPIALAFREESGRIIVAISPRSTFLR